MKSLKLPLIVSAFLAAILLAPTAEASAKLQPGSYSLRVHIKTGEIAGTVLNGTCVVARKTLTYTLKLPRGSRPSRTSGVANHGGRSTFTAASNIGKIRVSVVQSNRQGAQGRYTHRDSTGTWTLKRK